MLFVYTLCLKCPCYCDPLCPAAFLPVRRMCSYRRRFLLSLFSSCWLHSGSFLGDCFLWAEVTYHLTFPSCQGLYNVGWLILCLPLCQGSKKADTQGGVIKNKAKVYATPTTTADGGVATKYSREIVPNPGPGARKERGQSRDQESRRIVANTE